MKVIVDAIACDGYVKCLRIAPTLFRMNDRNVAVPIVEGELTPEQLKLAEMAAKMCPSKAIQLTD